MKTKVMGRPMDSKSMIEELAIEIEATADHADDKAIPAAKRSEMLQTIRRASVVLISVNNGLRTPRDPHNPRLAKIMGS